MSPPRPSRHGLAQPGADMTSEGEHTQTSDRLAALVDRASTQGQVRV